MKEVCNIVVHHPELGSYTAVAVTDRLQAVIRAGRHWNRQWSQLARECSFTQSKRNQEGN